MFESLIDDIKHTFKTGNMVTRLVIINIAIFMVTALISAFAPAFYNAYIYKFIAIPGDLMALIYKPWTFFTYMFVHSGLWHLIWNMLIFYWFGRIVGDLIGDRHIWPLYFLGGIAGALAFLISAQFLPHLAGSTMIGASAGIMCVVIVAGIVNPDHYINLLLIGPVKIKFIILVIIFFDLLGVAGMNNTGGHIAHLGGMIMGWMYMIQLRNRVDLANTINGYTDAIGAIFSGNTPTKKPKSKLKVTFKSEKIKSKTNNDQDLQVEVDKILEKIKAKGYGSLSDEEKETLYQASKK